MQKLPMSLLIILLSCSAASAAVEQPEQKPCREPCPINDDSTPVPRMQELLNQFDIRYRDLNKYTFGAPLKLQTSPTNPYSTPTIMCIAGEGCKEIQ
jgi:hypothetical protein